MIAAELGPNASLKDFDRGAEGAGVGLSLVRHIVEAHGGRIWVESSGPGSGAVFLFTLGPACRGARRGPGS